jgi:Bacterial Ig domain
MAAVQDKGVIHMTTHRTTVRSAALATTAVFAIGLLHAADANAQSISGSIAQKNVNVEKATLATVPTILVTVTTKPALVVANPGGALTDPATKVTITVPTTKAPFVIKPPIGVDLNDASLQTTTTLARSVIPPKIGEEGLGVVPPGGSNKIPGGGIIVPDSASKVPGGTGVGGGSTGTGTAGTGTAGPGTGTGTGASDATGTGKGPGPVTETNEGPTSWPTMPNDDSGATTKWPTTDNSSEEDFDTAPFPRQVPVTPFPTAKPKVPAATEFASSTADRNGVSLKAPSYSTPVRPTAAPVEIRTANNSNQAPMAAPFTANVRKNALGAIALIGLDPDGQQVSFAVLELPKNGALTGTAPNLRYKPNKGFTGADTFMYLANDGQLNSKPAMVVISVSDGKNAKASKVKNGKASGSKKVRKFRK